MSFETLFASNDADLAEQNTGALKKNNKVIPATKKNKAKGIVHLSLEKLSPHRDFFQKFLSAHPHLKGIEFIEEMLEHFQFSFQTPWKEQERIPAEGRLVIVANHPLGSLDAAALFKTVSDIRPDVKVMVESRTALAKSLDASPLSPLVLIYHSESEELPDAEFSPNKSAYDYLGNDGALIFFPSKEISRMSPSGIKDGKWQPDFLKLALAAQAPVLPVHIDAVKSALFYGVSAISKPLSSFLVMPELYKQTGKAVAIRIGDLITHDTFSQSGLPLKAQAKLFKKHVYKIGKGKKGIWPTQSAIAHPEDRKSLKHLIASQVHLGETADSKQIYLYQNAGSCAVLREIGRLRELAFRAVGEGTGQRRDIDQYDASYSQLVLWDERELEVVGAYRLAKAKEIIQQKGLHGLYSASLFDYHEALFPILEQGAELGRSFVQPKYWGKRSLDYLWYGIGSFLSENPDIRYLFGPVSLSNDMPKTAKDLLVYFFTLYFGQVSHQQAFLANAMPASQIHSINASLATSKTPYLLSSDVVDNLKGNFTGKDYSEDFKTLKHILSNMGCSVPTLFKQYSELCEEGGLVFLDFGVDSAFNDCVDGLVIVDVSRIKEKKRKRYIPSTRMDIPSIPSADISLDSLTTEG